MDSAGAGGAVTTIVGMTSSGTLGAAVIVEVSILLIIQYYRRELYINSLFLIGYRLFMRNIVTGGIVE